MEKELGCSRRHRTMMSLIKSNYNRKNKVVDVVEQNSFQKNTKKKNNDLYRGVILNCDLYY